MLELAIDRKASDLHLVVGFPPSLRINGDLQPIPGTLPLSSSELMSLILPLLSPTQKATFDTNFELDFGFSFENKARFRVNCYKQSGDPAAALRFIPIEIPAIETLGLPPIIPRLTQLRQGLILVTGPTGHGKSTTLASFINKINHDRPAHILTIEDPVEYVYPKAKAMVSQRELFLDTKGWAPALKSALREDPDVVLVGEMRDFETISAALTIAETGHLVLATLHTNSAAQSIDRMIDVFPANQQAQVRLQLSVVLEAILSQRLIPTISPGRALAAELLLKAPALSELIRSSKTPLIDNLIQTSGQLGMMTLETSLVELVKSGKVDYQTAIEYSLRPDLFAKLMGR